MVFPFGTEIDRRTHDQWVQLKMHVLRARSAPNCCSTDESLEATAEREPDSPVSPAYRLWIADNFARDGHLLDAARAYDTAVDRSQVCATLQARSFVKIRLRRRKEYFDGHGSCRNPGGRVTILQPNRCWKCSPSFRKQNNCDRARETCGAKAGAITVKASGRG